jgi:hypothetical protein
MLFREIIAVYFENRKKHTVGESGQCTSVKAGGILEYSNTVLKGLNRHYLEDTPPEEVTRKQRCKQMPSNLQSRFQRN